MHQIGRVNVNMFRSVHKISVMYEGILFLQISGQCIAVGYADVLRMVLCTEQIICQSSKSHECISAAVYLKLYSCGTTVFTNVVKRNAMQCLSRVAEIVAGSKKLLAVGCVSDVMSHCNAICMYVTSSFWSAFMSS